MLNQRQLVRAENHSNTAARFLLLPLGVLHVELPPSPRPSPSYSLPEPSEHTGFCRATVQPRSPPLTGFSPPPLPHALHAM